MFEIGRVGWSYSFVSSSLQQGYDVISQFDIEGFSKVTRVTPEQRRVFVLFAVTLAGIFANWENPRDYRQFFLAVIFPEGEVKDVLRAEVKSSDNLLILFEEGIIRRCKSNQW